LEKLQKVVNQAGLAAITVPTAVRPLLCSLSLGRGATSMAALAEHIVNFKEEDFLSPVCLMQNAATTTSGPLAPPIPLVYRTLPQQTLTAASLEMLPARAEQKETQEAGGH